MATANRRCVTVIPQGWSPPLDRNGKPRPGWTYWVPGYVGRLRKGDWVIVEAPRDERGQLVEQSGMPVCAEVTEVRPPKAACKIARRWLVGKIEWDAYRALQALAPPEED